MKYFQEQESFSMDDFSEKVIRQPEVVESFVDVDVEIAVEFDDALVRPRLLLDG